MIAGNVAQAFQFFSTGNTDYALVGMAQWRYWPQRDERHAWLVPEHYYAPLQQDAVILARARRPAADRFLRFLQSDAAASIMRADGYRPGTAP